MQLIVSFTNTLSLKPLLSRVHSFLAVFMEISETLHFRKRYDTTSQP